MFVGTQEDQFQLNQLSGTKPEWEQEVERHEARNEDKKRRNRDRWICCKKVHIECFNSAMKHYHVNTGTYLGKNVGSRYKKVDKNFRISAVEFGFEP